MPDGSAKMKRRKPFNADATLYYGRTVLVGAVERVLSRRVVDRLVRIEADNQRRADKHDGAIVEPVDFVAVCIEQCWRCSICGEPMDPDAGKPERKITVEHNPALSVCHEHSRRTVEAAHSECNCAKNNFGDTSRAAKIKRVQKDEDRHATRMRAKANLSRDAYRRLKLDEAKLKSSGRKIVSRPFQQTMRKKMNGEVVPR